MISDIFAGMFYVKSENHTRGLIHSQIDGKKHLAQLQTGA